MLKSLQTDGCDPAEVARPELTFEPAPELLDVNPRFVAGGIHLLGRRCEQEVDTRRLGGVRVALLVARIAGEVLGRPKLRGVDEEARDDDVALVAGRRKERNMAGVE